MKIVTAASLSAAIEVEASKLQKKIQKRIRDNYTGEPLKMEEINNLLESAKPNVRTKTVSLLAEAGFSVSHENKEYTITM